MEAFGFKEGNNGILHEIVNSAMDTIVLLETEAIE